MREARARSPCLLGFTQLGHNATPFELEFLLTLRAVSNAQKKLMPK